MLDCPAFSLISGLPSPLSADGLVSLFEWFIGTIPLCDSSQTCTWAVWLKPSPADLLPGWTAGVSEVSRFSCMKFLGVLWGLRPRRTEQKLALSLLSMLPSEHVYRVGVRVVCFRGFSRVPPTWGHSQGPDVNANCYLSIDGKPESEQMFSLTELQDNKFIYRCHRVRQRI